jgi:hypothetical protein
MDRNLGASRVATSSNDAQAYGDLYQWGRFADGHQCRNSPTTNTLSSTDQPLNGAFILTNSNPRDWRSPQNNNLWQVGGLNNPCPNGYRLPSEIEWNVESASWSSLGNLGAFNSRLKLPSAGVRDGGGGSLFNQGVTGYYWSSEIKDNRSGQARFSSTVGIVSVVRADGASVRCIKN